MTQVAKAGPRERAETKFRHSFAHLTWRSVRAW
jgi:hypothetical protein